MEKDIFKTDLAKLLYDYSGKIQEIHNLCTIISKNKYDHNLEIILQRDLKILLKSKEKLRKKIKNHYYKMYDTEFKTFY